MQFFYIYGRDVQLVSMINKTLNLKHIARSQDSLQERDVETVSILRDGADFRCFLTPSLLSTLVTSGHDDRARLTTSFVSIQPSASALLRRGVQHRFKGPFIKDVRTEGGRRGVEKSPNFVDEQY